MTSRPTIDVIRAEPTLSLILCGEFDAPGADEAADLLGELLDTHDGDVELDLAGITFIGIAGVQLLADVARAVERTGRHCSIINPSPLFDRISTLLHGHTRGRPHRTSAHPSVTERNQTRIPVSIQPG